MNETKLQEPKTQRVYYLDILRVIACLAVIMIHTCSGLVSAGVGSASFWISNILDAASRVAVPLFAMISGALMLDSEYSFIAKKHWNHIKKLILFFCFWSLVYDLIFQVLLPLFRGDPIQISTIISSFIAGHYHLWYIYMQIGMYFLVPILRSFVKHENKKYVMYFLCLALIFTFIIPPIFTYGKTFSPVFARLSSVFQHFHLDFVGGYTAYFILGWYLHNYDLKAKKLIYALGIGGFLFTALATYVLSACSGKAIQAYGDLTFHVLLQGVAVFVFIKDKFSAKIFGEDTASKIVRTISRYSLGIYGIHALFVSLIAESLLHIGVSSALVLIPVVFVATLILSVLCIAVMQRVPFLKKYV